MSKRKATRKKKMIVILLLLALVLAAAVWGLLYLRSQHNRAYVERVGDINQTWVLYNSEISGMIDEGAQQSVYLQPTEQVAEVYVSPGQKVTAGQPLFRYDTASLELEVKQRELEVDSCAAALSLGRQQLAAYEDIVPVAADEPIIDEPGAEEPGWVITPEQQLPEVLSGTGSPDDPLIYLCREETLVSGQQLNQWREQELCVRLEQRAGNDPAGELQSCWTVDGRNFPTVADSSLWSVSSRSVWLPPEPEEPDYPDDPQEPQASYTQAQKDKLIAGQKLTLRRLENSLAMAENALDISRDKLVDATVRALLGGTVRIIGDPAAPPQDGTPFCTVQAAGGLTVVGYLNELELDRTRVGDKVTVYSWFTGDSVTAVITAVADYPAAGQHWEGQGNPNASYYEFTAFVEEGGEGFNVGDGVSVRPYMDEDDDAIVLQSIYVRSDEGGAYVMADDGSGRLTRRSVTVVPTSESEFVQITSGLTQDDYVAFPYGDTAREGTLTTTDAPLILF